MTSEEIRAYVERVRNLNGPVNQLPLATFNLVGEIAIQLAKFNERSGPAHFSVRSTSGGHEVRARFGSMTVLSCSCGWTHVMAPGALERDIAHVSGKHFMESGS